MRHSLLRKSAALALAGALAFAVATPAFSADAVAPGTPIPHQLEVPDQNDQVQSFVTVKKNRGLIMLFSRSLGW